MNHPAQRAVAAIVVVLVQKKNYRTVYDEHQHKHFSLFVDIRENRIRVHETESRTDIAGQVQGDGYALYNYATRKHISLKLEGEHFNGYDFESGKHFDGEVHGSNVALYDHETSSRSHYALS